MPRLPLDAGPTGSKVGKLCVESIEVNPETDRPQRQS
jgi:hypothetical protein